MPKCKIYTDLVTQYFETNPDRVFALSDLEHLFVEKNHEWNLPPSMTSHTFVQMLLTCTKLSELRLRSHHYSSLLRYSWEGKASPISVAISIKKDDAFFSHGSAMWIHGLSGDHENIFLNKEQSEKRRNSAQLSQEAIDRAFRNQQRFSRLAYKYKDAKITLLSGKHTGRLDVQSAVAPSGHQVEVTSLERTLVDITVRPAYSGGVSNVLQAFRLAKNRVSISKLITLLRKFDYTYPYHQSIGFYLKRAGYTEADQLLARAEGVKFNFYLCHGLKGSTFDPDWRVFSPRTLK
jgi:hypothetical protein